MSGRVSRGAPVTVDFEGGKLTGRHLGITERQETARPFTERVLVGEGIFQRVHETVQRSLTGKAVFLKEVQGFTGLKRPDGTEREFCPEELEEIWEFDQPLAARMLTAIELGTLNRDAGKPTEKEEAEAARKNCGGSPDASEG